MRLGRILCAVGAACLVPAAAGAAAIFYTDRSVWQAAAGAPSFSEDFSGFTEDTSFRDVPAALSGLSIEQIGHEDFRNLIDVGPPFDFTEHGGTNHASVFTEFGGSSTGDVIVAMIFDQDNLAFGFDHWAAADAEGARLQVWNGASLLGSVALSDDFPGFTGYLLDGGDVATHVTLQSIQDLGSAGEGFGIDDLAGVAVPEPAAGLLLAAGLALLGASRRR